MKNSKLPWRIEANSIKCTDNYNVGSVNSHKTTEGEANAELIVKAVNEHAALVAVAEWALQFKLEQRNVDSVIANNLGVCLRDLAALRAGQPVTGGAK